MVLGGNCRRTFLTSYASHLYVGVGEPSSETQVRLIFCPYSAVPNNLQIGFDGKTVKQCLFIQSVRDFKISGDTDNYLVVELLP